MLLQYTIFHLQVFIALVAAAASAVKLLSAWFLFSGACFLFSGIAAGVIATNIPESENYGKFVKKEIGFFIFNYKYEIWTKIQHFYFWLGVFTAIAAFLAPVHDLQR